MSVALIPEIVSEILVRGSDLEAAHRQCHLVADPCDMGLVWSQAKSP